MPIATMVVDDEKQARDGLKVLLERDPDIEVVAFCSNGMEAIEQIHYWQPKLLFLDVQMPEINGFEVLGSLQDYLMPAVIFATAYDQYALQAFEVHAIDYLLKPFTDKRFFQALTYAKSQILPGQTPLSNIPLQSLLTDYQKMHHNTPPALVHQREHAGMRARLIIKSGGKIHFVPMAHIRYLTATDYYVTVVADQGEYMVRESLKSLLERLPADRFLRIHRSHVVNVDRIKTVEPYANGDFYITLRSGVILRGSRSYRKELYEKYGLA